MHNTYLEVTFRGGRPLAAYFYLPRKEGDHSVSVKKHGSGLVVDLAQDGRPIGIEIAIPEIVTVEAVNEVLRFYGLDPISSEELAPLKKAA
jgi:hypothetical protein